MYYLFNVYLQILAFLRVWSIADKKLANTLPVIEGAGQPSSVCWVVGEAAHCIVGYGSAVCTIVDTETGNLVIKLDTAHDPVSGQVITIKKPSREKGLII